LDAPVPVLHLDAAAGKSAGHVREVPYAAGHLAALPMVEAVDAAAARCKPDEVPSAEQSCAAQADLDAAQSAAPASVLRAVLRMQALPESELMAVHLVLPPQVQPGSLLQARPLAPKAQAFLLVL
jgi:hypothetical protein